VRVGDGCMRRLYRRLSVQFVSLGRARSPPAGTWIRWHNGAAGEPFQQPPLTPRRKWWRTAHAAARGRGAGLRPGYTMSARLSPMATNPTMAVTVECGRRPSRKLFQRVGLLTGAGNLAISPGRRTSYLNTKAEMAAKAMRYATNGRSAAANGRQRWKASHVCQRATAPRGRCRRTKLERSQTRPSRGRSASSYVSRGAIRSRRPSRSRRIG
jgi:hypothetical protein